MVWVQIPGVQARVKRCEGEGKKMGIEFDLIEVGQALGRQLVVCRPGDSKCLLCSRMNALASRSWQP